MDSSTPLPRMLLVSLVLLLACSKGSNDSNNNAPPGNERPFIYVSEAVTNVPLAGAHVNLLKCTRPDFEFGCLGYGTVGTFTTDSSGKAFYNRDLDWYRAEASKENYWPWSGRSSSLALYPVCYMKVRLIKSSPLKPDESLYIAGTDPPCTLCWSEFKGLGQPADTTVYLKGYGNLENWAQWDIRSQDSAAMYVQVQQTPPVFIHRFDTAHIVINY